MPSKNFGFPYLHNVNSECIDLCDEIAEIVDSIDRHLACSEIPQEGELQTAGLYYTKVGELVTIYGTCTPSSFIIAKVPFKPVLHSASTWMPLAAYKKDTMTPLYMRMTAEGNLLCSGAPNNEIIVQFTYATMD